MFISSWIQSFGGFFFSSAHADELEKTTASLLQRVEQLKKDVDDDARTFAEEKVKFQAVSLQLTASSGQAVAIEEAAAKRLPALEQLEAKYIVKVEKVKQAATLAFVPESVTALKKELDGSMREFVEAGKGLKEAFEALEKRERGLL